MTEQNSPRLSAPNWPTALAAEALAEFERIDEWDRPPSLYVVLPGRLEPWSMPDRIWGAAHPAAVLRELAAVIRLIGGSPYAADLLGVMLVSEGWSIVETSSSTRGADYWQTHSIADDPAGREVAMATIVTKAGRSHVRSLERGGAAHGMDGATGRLVDAVREVCEALAVQS